MWWVGSKPYDLYLGTRGFAACCGSKVLRAHAVDNVEQAFAALTTWLDEEATSERLNVWLSGGLCRPVYLKPLAGLQTQGDWERVARATATSLAGLAEPCEVWVERRAGGAGGHMAAAMPQAVIGRVLAAAPNATKKRRVARLAPWWSEALRVNSLCAQVPVLAVRDCDSLTVFAGEGDEFSSVAVYTPVLDDASAQAAMARALMSTDVEDSVARVATLVLAEGQRNEGGALAPLTEWSK